MSTEAWRNKYGYNNPKVTRPVPKPLSQNPFSNKYAGKGAARGAAKGLTTVQRLARGLPALKAVPVIGQGAMAIGAGAAIGTAMANNPDLVKNTSGRGAGRAAFKPEKSTGGSSSLPNLDPRRTNDNLAAYDDSVTLPGMNRDYGDKYSDKEIEAGKKAEKYREGAGFTPSQLPKPADPNNTGGKGTQMTINPGKPIPQMTYESFMRDIGDNLGLNVKDRFVSTNLPGTPGYGESFAADAGEVGRKGVTMEDMNELDAIIANGGAMVDGRIVPKVTLNAQAEGAAADQRERDRQLTPGNVDTAQGKRYAAGNSRVKMRDPRNRQEDDERFTNFAEQGPDNSELTGGISERGRAFLDAPMGSGYGAVRAAHATRGGIRQGNQFFIRDSSQESGLQEVNREQYYSVVNDNKSLKDVLNVASPSSSQNPVVDGGKDGAEVIDDEPTLKAKGFAGKYAQKVVDFANQSGQTTLEGVKGAIMRGLEGSRDK